MLITHISITKVLLGELGLPETDTVQPPAAAALVLPPADRLRILRSCARALREYFDVRCQPWAEVEQPRFLCMRGLDVTYGLITAGRLVTLKLPGWDLDRIEAELDFWGIMDWVIGLLRVMTLARRTGDGAGQYRDDEDGEDSLERLLRVATGLKEVLRHEIDKAKREVNSTGGYYPSPDGGGGGGGVEVDMAMQQDEADSGLLGLELWKDMIDDGQWDMVGEFQWL